MRKSTMDKVFDLLADENLRFARLLEDAERIRPIPEKPRIDAEFIEAKRGRDQKDTKLTFSA